jgi:2-polyprenyl-3-methyl-5-hydroxy-6-metoxy-1,4-benzoquinol methylase
MTTATSTATTTQPSMDEIMGFAFKVVGELGAALAGAHVYIGDRLGLFKTLAQEPVTTEQLAHKTGLQERYLREWCAAMAASGFVDYDPAARTFVVPAAKAAVLVDEDSPVFVGGFAQMIPDHYTVIPRVIDAFKNGGGVPYTDYTSDTFEGTERFFRPGYVNFLVQEWLPAAGFGERLERGAKVADVGCGRGQAVCTMAKAFPNSSFYGFDNHGPGIDAARANAKRLGVSGNTTWEVRASTELPQSGDFDLVSTLDALHDMVDPHGAGRSIYGALKPGGAWFIVEPNVGDNVEDNLNPVGRVFYSVSMLQCMTASLAHGGAGYGACMGPAKIQQIARDAGFSNVERLPIENPFNQFWLATK